MFIRRRQNPASPTSPAKENPPVKEAKVETPQEEEKVVEQDIKDETKATHPPIRQRTVVSPTRNKKKETTTPPKKQEEERVEATRKPIIVQGNLYKGEVRQIGKNRLVAFFPDDEGNYWQAGLHLEGYPASFISNFKVGALVEGSLYNDHQDRCIMYNPVVIEEVSSYYSNAKKTLQDGMEQLDIKLNVIEVPEIVFHRYMYSSVPDITKISDNELIDILVQYMAEKGFKEMVGISRNGGYLFSLPE